MTKEKRNENITSITKLIAEIRFAHEGVQAAEDERQDVVDRLAQALERIGFMGTEIPMDFQDFDTRTDAEIAEELLIDLDLIGDAENAV